MPIFSHHALQVVTISAWNYENDEELGVRHLTSAISNLAAMSTSIRRLDIFLWDQHYERWTKPTRIEWLKILVEPFGILADACKSRVQASINFGRFSCHKPDPWAWYHERHLKSIMEDFDSVGVDVSF